MHIVRPVMPAYCYIKVVEQTNMSNTGAIALGFARLNNILGQSSQICKYDWDGGNVEVSLNQFDKAAYLNAKIAKLEKKESVLSRGQKCEVVDRIARENNLLLNDLANSHGAQFQQLDAQFDFLLLAAFALTEHSHQLSSSMRNIERTREASNSSWMSASEVRALMALTGSRTVATNSRKFVSAV